MRLRTLRLQGFKSFADRTALEFRDGVTAIVGSNGCGKSNLADAIRWVLGEQRASAIRGGKMEEIIFQGTSRRRAHAFAEVTLLFSNEDRRIAVPQSEIEITRRTFREGGSDYALNRSACRLRDIQALLRDTGLGAHAYSIIEAGMIEVLLSDRADERRGIFEEAAGIGRYKESRQATTRRLAAAEADLARLGDLIAEVDAKVRHLAKQRRRAQRREQLQERRLQLEVTLATHELAELEAQLAETLARGTRLQHDDEAARTERVRLETALDACAAVATRARQDRAARAQRLDEIRTRLHVCEREQLLADERRAHAELRGAELRRERAEQAARRTALQREAESWRQHALRATAGVEAARQRLAEALAAHTTIRARLSAERAAAEAAAAEIADLARSLAAQQGERAAAETAGAAAETRRARAVQEERELATELGRLHVRLELLSDQAITLRSRRAELQAALDASRAQLQAVRQREREAGDALRTAEAELARTTARLEAGEALERGYGDFSPAVAAVMAARDRFTGVHAPLADFVVTRGTTAASRSAAEAYLGNLLQALVIDDLATARRLRQWFYHEWSGGGSLVLLPLDALEPHATPSGAPDAAIAGTGAGGAWVEALLRDVSLADGDTLDAFRPGRARASRDGEVVDARGIVRLGQRAADDGILTRRELLASLRSEREARATDRDRLAAQAEALRVARAAAEERAEQDEQLTRAATGELGRLETEAAAETERQQRALRARGELAESVSALGAAAAGARARVAELAAHEEEAAVALSAATAAAEAARARLRELEAAWDAARQEEGEIRVEAARGEAELREAERRAGGANEAAEAAAARLSAIDREATELSATLEALALTRERASTEAVTLLAEREAEATAIAAVDARLAAAEAELASDAERLRVARAAESRYAEERHRLELAVAELRARGARVRDRLSAEWGRPWEALSPAAAPLREGGPEEWHAETRALGAQLEALGPVNMVAVAEHEEESRRLEFLQAQQSDLIAARDDLGAAIRQINRTAREVFVGTFAAIRENFQRTFHSLFEGGECDVWLTDPDDPLESPIEIQASPRGKRTQRIHLLSGGERTLTALALLFAIYLVKPSPVCVLDEVDAPLDETNVCRFIRLLQEFKRDTQFIVITHNMRTMEAADWVYGVTMEEPGVSSIVGVELEAACGRGALVGEGVATG